MKSQTLSNGIEIVSMEKQIASVPMRLPLAAAAIFASENLAKRAAQVSQFYHDGTVNVGKDSSQFTYENAGDVLPKPEDYITVDFRAISKTVVPGHWIDWSQGDVLKDSVPKLLNQTVYPNHDFTDINDWLGSVSAVAWDEAGAQSEGVPGINATYKIDALMNPRIARGLLMRPPAIHSTSMTVLFRFEYSHPEIAAENRWRFFELLGEEVEGEVVRLIATEVLEYLEASLVFQGADRLAKRRRGEDEAAMSIRSFALADDLEFIDKMIEHHGMAIKMVKEYSPKFEHDELKELGKRIIKAQSAEIRQMREWRKAWSKEDGGDDGEGDGGGDGTGNMAAPHAAAATNSNEEKRMKLTKEQKAELGIEFDGDEVPETEILKAAEKLAAKQKDVDQINIAELQKKAQAGEAYIAKQREGVARLARLAELGADAGDLDEVISQQIAEADFDRLVKLEGYFEKRVADRFPKGGRSSKEDSAPIEGAGKVNQEKKTVPAVGLH